MLRFTIENFRSISERKTMLFTPSAIKDEPRTNVVDNGELPYLRTTAIYGANSSGKSNFIKGINSMSHLIVTSIKLNDNEALPYEPFLLNKKKANAPTLYEADFVTEGVHYRYGFSNTDQKICDEWLIRIDGKDKETRLFVRDLEGIGVDEEAFSEGKDLEERTNDNRLFLSLVGQLGGDISNSVLHFFRKGLGTLSGLNTDPYNSFTKFYLNRKGRGSKEMMRFFDRVQLGFSDLTPVLKEFNPEELPQDMPKAMKEKLRRALSGKQKIQIFSSHGIYDDEGKKVDTEAFDFNDMESAGTCKLFDLAGPIFTTLNTGNILVVDELDAKMHPLISQELVSLFNDPKRNKKGAQLIFTTHDTNLLASRLLRRDQIWFTEKDEQERTDLYNMMQIVLPDGTKPRGDGNIERNYIRGRYGAIPYIRSYTD